VKEAETALLPGNNLMEETINLRPPAKNDPWNSSQTRHLCPVTKPSHEVSRLDRFFETRDFEIDIRQPIIPHRLQQVARCRRLNPIRRFPVISQGAKIFPDQRTQGLPPFRRRDFRPSVGLLVG